MNSKDHARRQELRSLVDSCYRDDYVSSDCPSTHSLGQQCDAWSELMACDAKIAQMEEELINIYRSRFLLKEKVNRSHDKLLRKIPAEVISHIFDFCVNAQGADRDVSVTFRTTTSIKSSLLTLNRVSKAWGELVRTTPCLWASIGVRVNYEPFDVQFLRTWLNRSGEVPLSITLYFPYAGYGKFPDANLSLEMFEGCTHRWHHLAMDIHNDNICEDFFKHQIQENLDQLESLQIRCYGGRVGPNLQNFLRQTSRLKHIEISHLKSLSDDIRWSALTRLNIDDITWNVFFQILHLAPRLVQCEIGMTPASSFHPPPVTTLVHSGLQRFQIKVHEEDDPLQPIYLDKLRFPSLMDFVYDAYYVSSDIYDIESMIIESQCTITHASLTLYSESDEADSVHKIMDLLDILPALTHLTFDVNFADKSLLGRLAANGQGQFLPRLESLELQYFSPYTSALAHIADALDPNGRSGEIEVVHQRPLCHAIFKVDEHREQLLELVSQDEDAFLRLLEAKNLGLSLKLLDNLDEDIFQRPEIVTRFVV